MAKIWKRKVEIRLHHHQQQQQQQHQKRKFEI